MTQPTTEAWAAAGIDFSVRDAVAWVTLNRPELRNAVDVRMRNALLAAIEEIRDDPGIRAAVVTGAGSAFCSGADLSGPDPVEASPERRRGDTGIIAREDARRFGWWRVIKAVWENEKPFIAAVNGPAYGFGCNFALACDLVIAAESATFCEIFVRRGLPLEALGAYVLARSLSPVRAKEIALLGDAIPGIQAAEWGLANRCVPDDQLITVAGELAAGWRVAPRSASATSRASSTTLTTPAWSRRGRTRPRCSACAARRTAQRRSRPSSNAGRRASLASSAS
jgi:2-(1,2-epoxy-1,2-dihydrophenyl)acetyl-CoA isomerase